MLQALVLAAETPPVAMSVLALAGNPGSAFIFVFLN